MADTGYNWDANWSVLEAALAQQEGEASATHQFSEIDLDGKAACLISIDTDYSDHAKATAGLKVYVLRDIDDTVYESVNGAAVAFEMPFTQNNTERKTFFLSAQQFQKFVLYFDWANTTTDAVATSAVAIKYATIPAAS